MRYLLILVYGLVGVHLFAQQEEQVIYKLDSLSKPEKKVQFIGLPIVFYTPETSAGFGGGAQVFLLKQANQYNSRISNILVSAVYTLNNQVLVDVKPSLFIQNGNYLLDLSLKFQIFPNSFWGIGNRTPDSNRERYNMTSTTMSFAFLRRLPPSLNFGFEYVLEFHDVTEVDSAGILDEAGILGADRAVISGLGMVFNLDTRDDDASPRRGSFLQFKGRFSSKNFGATSDFNKFVIDLRTYVPLGKRSALAFQLFSDNNFGDVPFQALAWFGGGQNGRGYFRGRFMDKLMYVLQSEFRWRFHPRWIWAGFALVGEVTDLPRNFFDDLKPSLGTGIRFQFVKSRNTLLRLDIGFGKDGNNGFYFGINEAF